MAKFQQGEAIWVKPFGGSNKVRGTIIDQVASPRGTSDAHDWYSVHIEDKSVRAVDSAIYAEWRLEPRRESIDDATGQEWNAASKLAAVTFRPKEDVVNDPQHYGGADNPYEVIKVLEAWGLHEDAYLFNVIKYLARAGKKDKDKDLQDHQKALYYLKRKIANMEKESK